MRCLLSLLPVAALYIGDDETSPISDARRAIFFAHHLHRIDSAFGADSVVVSDSVKHLPLKRRPRPESYDSPDTGLPELGSPELGSPEWGLPELGLPFQTALSGSTESGLFHHSPLPFQTRMPQPGLLLGASIGAAIKSRIMPSDVVMTTDESEATPTSTWPETTDETGDDDNYLHELFPDADDIIMTIADEFNWTSGAIGAAAAGGLMGVFACGVWSYNRFSTTGFADQTESISVYDSESILGADLDEFLN